MKGIVRNADIGPTREMDKENLKEMEIEEFVVNNEEDYEKLLQVCTSARKCHLANSFSLNQSVV